jgi:hypothetical protein
LFWKRKTKTRLWQIQSRRKELGDIMETQPNQPDAAIDKTLAALNSAAPPEGLESRIAARISARPAPAVSPWRDRFTGYTLASAWWRGAAAGAAVAMLAVAAVLLLQHKTPSSNGIAVATPTHALTITPVSTAASATPCAHPAILHEPRPAPALTSIILRAEVPDAGSAPSHPAPVRPLTAQERALVELARTADPKMLAALAPETQAKVEAQEEDNFNKFFAPPPAPPQPADSPSPTNTQDNRSAPKEGEQI